MDELQHRVKNALATANSIINQAVDTKCRDPALADTVKRRIGALTATHDLLMSHDWHGACGALSDVGGTLDVNWVVKVDDSGRKITIDWQEVFSRPARRSVRRRASACA
ncbi:MAG: hypothetical protein FJX35_02270 [Alphaproteobacteria bacterium]|nr:hypothetical protein [Alphaproteobacteria bacterium]